MARKRKGTKTTTKSAPLSPVDHTLLLTENIVHRVFDHLSSFSIFQAGRVSQRWRHFAQSHPRYYAEIVLETGKLEYRSDFEWEGIQFSHRVKKAYVAGLRVYPIVRVRYDPRDFIDDGAVFADYPTHTPSDFDIVRFLESSVFSVLRRYMSQIARLLLNVPVPCFDATMRTLTRKSAPSLEWLSLGFQGEDGHLERLAGLTLPIDLFKGCAPNLQTVHLEALRLEPPTLALATARDVRLAGYSNAVLPYLSSLFPLAERITFFDLAYESDETGVPVAHLGEHVKHIQFEGAIQSGRALDALDQLLHAHPVMSIAAHFQDRVSNTMLCAFLHHKQPPFDVSLRLEIPSDDEGNRNAASPRKGKCDMILDIRSLSSNFHRSFRAELSMGSMLFDALKEVGPYIETLGISDTLLPVLVKCCDSLPALKTLTIDMDFPPRADSKSAFLQFWNDTSSSGNIECPQLETVHVVCTRYKAQLVDTGAIRLLGRFGVKSGGRVLQRLILDGVELRFASQLVTLELLALMREIVTQNMNLEEWRYGYGPPVSEYICIW